MPSPEIPVPAWEINPSSGWLDLRIRGSWHYKDLVLRLVRRDFLVSYRQTVLGPIWLILQPLLTTLTYIVIFSKVAGISTDGLPAMPFYLAGILVWNFFSECMPAVSSTFSSNAAIFGKVYFPRLVVPVAAVVSQLLRFTIQLGLFFPVLLYYTLYRRTIHPNLLMLAFPLLIVIIAGIALGTGLILSVLTAKYRDLNNLIYFGLRLMMFVTPVIYPLSIVPSGIRFWVRINPLTPLTEAFRYAFLGKGQFSWGYLAYSFICMAVILFAGIALFNRMEDQAMDVL
ncbi:MAG TPA: ABC transporter permease [Chitinophagaceae bacterium]|nr:ABC transporter permease [Chitinophagaceae bacterium]